jgi:aspartyl-tRNA(Asn)/glutamyl-tRNA(Gln) amidotransferase subunit A
MDLDNLCYLSARQLSRLIKNREVSPVELTKAHLTRIDALEPTLNSFITVMHDQAMEDARKAEQEIRTGRYRGPLHGIPVGVKDLFYVKGIRNTSGSKIFDRFIPDFDGTLILRLKEAGVVLLGKLNLHQFAYGATGENPDYGPMHNPWNPERITGGSSGGSASAAASGQCAFSLGTDTGGSIRIPSALCGLVGLKPTYGRLSRYGITVLSWSQDHAGPMARTVEDCALAMNALAGYDSNDPSSARVSVPDFTRALTGNIRGLKVGVPKEFFEDPIDPEVEDSVRSAIELLRKLGATVDEISWPMYEPSRAISSTILMAEATAYHRELILKHGSQLDFQVRLRLEAGFFISGADYIQAQRARRMFYHESRDLLKKVDLVAGPTVPITACKIGTTKLEIHNTSMAVIPALTQYTRPFDLNGFPAITLPCGFSREGLPIGLQLAGRPFDEETVLRAAHVFEQATEWHQRRPRMKK